MKLGIGKVDDLPAVKQTVTYKKKRHGKKEVLPEMAAPVNLGVSVRDLGHRLRYFPSRYPSPFKPGTLTRQWPDAEKSSMLRDVILRDSSMDG